MSRELEIIDSATMKPFIGLSEKEELTIELPRWHIMAEKGTVVEEDSVELCASYFPPGTQIDISVPICPKCQHPWYPDKLLNEYTENDWKCEGCGFDWKEWTEDEFI